MKAKKKSKGLLVWNGGLKIHGKQADDYVKNNCVSADQLKTARENFLNNLNP